jgi:hypothetical protein
MRGRRRTSRVGTRALRVEERAIDRDVIGGVERHERKADPAQHPPGSQRIDEGVPFSAVVASGIERPTLP